MHRKLDTTMLYRLLQSQAGCPTQAATFYGETQRHQRVLSLAPDASKNSVQSCFIQEGCGQRICGCAEETASHVISGAALSVPFGQA